MPSYAIGDIHGCNRSFQALLERLPLRPGDGLVLLGDLIDRGPDSRGVIDHVLRLREQGHSVVCLRGNHEQLLLDALPDPGKLERWLINGGRSTLDSFGVKRLQDMPAHYLDFFLSMPHWHAAGDYLCVHGGLNFACPDPLDDNHGLLWMRQWYGAIDYDWLGKRIVLHGHSPADLETIENQHAKLARAQYLNLDNGCVYAYLGLNRDGLGRLMAFSLDSKDLIGQKCVE